MRAPAHQHSITLTARPPRAVSWYLSFMSVPGLARIVLITCRATRVHFVTTAPAERHERAGHPHRTHGGELDGPIPMLNRSNTLIKPATSFSPQATDGADYPDEAIGIAADRTG